MQSVPRTMTYSPELETLLIMPIEEVADLRTRQLAKTMVPALKPTPVSVPGANGATLDIVANFTCAAASAGRNCSAGLRVRVSEDASSFLEVSFACPAERTADCQVLPTQDCPNVRASCLAEGVRIVSGR